MLRKSDLNFNFIVKVDSMVVAGFAGFRDATTYIVNTFPADRHVVLIDKRANRIIYKNEDSANRLHAEFWARKENTCTDGRMTPADAGIAAAAKENCK